MSADKILNLTQHVATPEQVAQGVVEPPDKSRVQALLTFDTRPTGETVVQRAEQLAAMAKDFFGPTGDHEDAPSAMIGGAPFLMAPLERALRRVNIHPEYAFSVRETLEVTEPDGRVVKTSAFRHVGFFLAIDPDFEE